LASQNAFPELRYHLPDNARWTLKAQVPEQNDLDATLSGVVSLQQILSFNEALPKLEQQQLG